MCSICPAQGLPLLWALMVFKEVIASWEGVALLSETPNLLSQAQQRKSDQRTGGRPGVDQ